MPPGEQYLSYVRLFKSEQLDELGGTDAVQRDSSGRQFVELYARLAQGTDRTRAALAIDRLTYLPGDLLVKLDRAFDVTRPGGAFAVHGSRCDSICIGIDELRTSSKAAQSGCLREAFADDLPSWVFKRKKMGFAVPIGDWFRGELRAMLRDSLFAADSFASSHFQKPAIERLVREHEQAKVDHSQRLYALLMLELWHRSCRT